MTDTGEVRQVFNAHDKAFAPYLGWPPLTDWIRAHGADPCDVYRAEIIVLDTALVRFYTYDRDEHGSLYVAPGSDPPEAATRPPYDVLLRRDPPELTLQARMRDER
jgi:hypothetical protein